MPWKLQSVFAILATLTVLLMCSEGTHYVQQNSYIPQYKQASSSRTNLKHELLEKILRELILQQNQQQATEDDWGEVDLDNILEQNGDKIAPPPNIDEPTTISSTDEPTTYELPTFEPTTHSPPSDDCIQSISVSAVTGLEPDASQTERDSYPKLVLSTEGGQYSAILKNEKIAGQKYEYTIDTSTELSPQPLCLTPSNVTGVMLVATGPDGWLIQSINVSVSADNTNYNILTKDIKLNKWVDGDEELAYSYSAKYVRLRMIGTNKPECGYGTTICDCTRNHLTCVINLEIDEIMTLTSYQRFENSYSESLQTRGTQGVLYIIDEITGEAKPHPEYEDDFCAKKENRNNCTDPQFVDGKTYRMGIGVNGQIPGPTIIVHEDQNVVIHVHNNLTIEGVSIHWHGMHQIGSPWMDGVGQVTQCQIGPSSTYTYNYIARPSGTFWYHSHSGAQRTDGFFGTLIVKETSHEIKRIRESLENVYNVSYFEDLPEKHSLIFLDWQLEASLNTFTHAFAGLGFYPNLPIGEIPSECDRKYGGTRGVDNSFIGPVPYFSGLINGKGRHPNVPYTKTRLSVFNVVKGQSYRFRLVGAQGLYAYKFSIDGHKLTVVGTDGYWTQPVKNVDFIIVHTGERYDFILEATKPVSMIKQYWMRGETLEVNNKRLSPPYPSLGHVAEGILQYVDDPSELDSDIPSKDYESIKLTSPPIKCSIISPCKAVNCPFEHFQSSYHTECINVHQLQLLDPTRPKELPEGNPSCKKCFHELDFSFQGADGWASINGRNFILPPVPPQTQNKDFYEQAHICNLTEPCSGLDCICTHEITIPYNETVQFVLSAGGAHPIHLHGHSFHVVDIGYPKYSPITGFWTERNYYNRTAADHSITNTTVRKDTVIIPAGGYVVINFLSDNPGYWFLHCHIETHQLEGMAMIVNEAPEEQDNLEIPAGLNQCGDFYLDMDDYLKILGTSLFNLAKGIKSSRFG